MDKLMIKAVADKINEMAHTDYSGEVLNREELAEAIIDLITGNKDSFPLSAVPVQEITLEEMKERFPHSDTLPCVTCGKPMPQTAVPAARAWCSDECYEKWEEERPKTSGVCIACGRPKDEQCSQTAAGAHPN